MHINARKGKLTEKMANILSKIKKNKNALATVVYVLIIALVVFLFMLFITARILKVGLE